MDQLNRIARRRRWRVALRRTVDWAALAGVVALVVRQSEPARNFVAWAWSRTGAWLFQTLFDMKPVGAVTYSIHWTTVLLLASLLALYALVRKLWADWDRGEMWLSLASQDTRRSNFPILVIMGVWLQLMVAIGIWRSSATPSYWQVMLCFVPGFIFMVTDLSFSDGSAGEKRAELRGPPEETTESDETFVGSLVSTAIFLGLVACMPFGLGVAGWSTLVWLSDHLFHGNLAGFRPASISSLAVGGMAVLVSALVWVISKFVRKQHSAVPPHGQK
jgi:hypothetical protein